MTSASPATPATRKTARPPRTSVENSWSSPSGLVTDPGISSLNGRDRRPGYDALMKAVARRELDMVASRAVDRRGRYLQNLVTPSPRSTPRGGDLYLTSRRSTPARPADAPCSACCRCSPASSDPQIHK
ncbi:recombinase family protein [Sphingomonas sp. TX0543]|uniref:recombinase family protein n=1 Tax=Sphingomonas sp. TX0543 TaxID=3399682 RepID=UPI003AFAEF44